MHSLWLGTMMVLLAGAASAQPATLVNARVEAREAGSGLARAFDAAVAEAAAPAWVGYSVPLAPGDRVLCDWSERGPRPQPATVKLEGPSTLHVLVRVEARAVSRVRMFSEGCVLDAGGLPVIWLNGVAPAESVQLLSRLAGAAGAARRVSDGALAAMAQHADAGAATALVAMARGGTSPRLRGQALFWVAQRAGDQALPAINEAIDRDPETQVKRQAVFALSQLPPDQGVPRLIEVAAGHSNPVVRRQAMFWLGQSRDPRALAFFERILLK